MSAPSQLSATDLGEVMSYQELGQQPDIHAGAADSTALRLPDGRIRLYYNEDICRGQAGCPGVEVGSAISADGVHFTVEPGVRLTTQFPPTFIPLPGGGWRAFTSDATKILSATTSDGLTFKLDDGVRLTQAQLGVTDPQLQQSEPLAAPGVVALPDGRYRLYVDIPVPGTQAPSSGGGAAPAGQAALGANDAVKSAISSNMVDWTVESGVRLGPGAPTLTGSAHHPFPQLGADGKVTVFFGSFDPFAVLASSSSDGLAFATEWDTGIHRALDNFPLPAGGGAYLDYYGTHSDATGNSVRVARLVPAPPASAGGNVPTITVAAVAVGLVVVLAVFVLLRRRRSASTS